MHHAPSANLNLRAAHVRVIVDVATSVLAITGLTTAWALGWTFLDPVVGMIGAAVIVSWTVGLASQAGGVLLDREPNLHLLATMRQQLGGDRVADQHLW